MKKYKIVYISLPMLNEKIGEQKALNEYMAEIQFRATHLVYKIISVEEE